MASQSNDIHANSSNNTVCQKKEDTVYDEDEDVMLKPNFTREDAISLTKRLHGYQDISCPKELNSYDNRNFLIEAVNPRGATGVDAASGKKKERFVLKFTNSKESKMIALHEHQNQLLLMLSKMKGIRCPVPLPNLQGELMTLETNLVSDKGGRKSVEFLTRMMKYIPGQPIGVAPTVTMKMCYEAGQLLGRLSYSMQEYDGDLSVFIERDVHFTWSLTNLSEVRKHLAVLTEGSQRKLIEEVLDAFEKKVSRVKGRLRKGLIHGDFNEQNILVRKTTTSPKINGHVSIRPTDDEKNVIGILDFDDVTYSSIVYDLGVAIMYIMTCTNLVRDPLTSGGAFLAGFLRENYLDDLEWDVLYYCIAARFAQSLVFGLQTYAEQPQNDYLLTTQTKGWDALKCLWSRERSDLYSQWRKIVKEFNE